MIPLFFNFTYITPMKPKILLRYFIALVWLANGLLAKVLNLIPRHQQIVGEILGETYARELTFMIGLSEIVMAIWIVWGFKSRLNAILQIVIIATMNILEAILVPELLLWGRVNALFALLFILLIYYQEFVLGKKSKSSQ